MSGARAILSVLATVGICLCATPAQADDAAPLPAEVVVTAEDYAKLLGAYGQIGPLTAERDAAQAALANMTEQRDRALELAAIRGQLRDEYRELAEIRRHRADEERARGDRLARARREDGFWATVRERAALGALAGSLAPFPPPPLNTITGAALGALYGALESLWQGP